jgi:hypothetical protein
MKCGNAQVEMHVRSGTHVSSSTEREGSTCMTATASHQPCLEEIEAWAHELEALHARIAPRFERSEPRRRSLARWGPLVLPRLRAQPLPLPTHRPAPSCAAARGRGARASTRCWRLAAGTADHRPPLRSARKVPWAPPQTPHLDSPRVWSLGRLLGRLGPRALLVVAHVRLVR